MECHTEKKTDINPEVIYVEARVDGLYGALLPKEMIV